MRRYLDGAAVTGAPVTAGLEVRLPGLARVLEPVMGIMLGRGLRADLQRLVAVLEGRPTAG